MKNNEYITGKDGERPPGVKMTEAQREHARLIFHLIKYKLKDKGCILIWEEECDT